jgi:ribosome biogenesis ATPase
MPCVSQELDVPLMNVAGPELIAGVSGESEERIRDLFDQAAENAPCILFLDEVDALAPNRHTAQREMERRVVAQLLSCLDGRYNLLCKCCACSGGRGFEAQ